MKVEPTGNIKTPEGLDLGNKIQLVVIDFHSRNAFYSQQFNPQLITPPDCYAFGKSIVDLRPDDPNLPMQQNEDCASCPLNQFSSAPGNSKAKACKNTREVVVRLIDPDGADSSPADAPLYVLAVSPTSLKAFDGMVQAVSRSVGPPVKAIVTMTATSAPGGKYATLSFSDPVPNADYAVDWGRRSEAAALLQRRPDYAAAAARAAAAPAPARRQVPARPAPRVAPRTR